MKLPTLLILVAVIAIITLAGYFVLVPKSSPSPTPQPIKETSNETGARVIRVRANNFRFDPDEIRVKVGEKVMLELLSEDMPHDFVVPELDLSVKLTPAGSSNSIEFTAEKTGEFEYYCSIANHRALGMTGTLIVE